MKPTSTRGAAQPTGKLLTLDEAAARLGIRRRSFKRWIANGAFPQPLRRGHRWVRVAESTLDAWLQARQQEGTSKRRPTPTSTASSPAPAAAPAESAQPEPDADPQLDRPEAPQQHRAEVVMLDHEPEPDDGTDLGPLILNDDDVKQLQHLVSEAPMEIGIIVSTMRRVLQTGAWMDRYDPNRDRRIRWQAEQFRDFVEKPISEGGLHTTVEVLRRLLADAADVLVLFEQAVDRGRGGANNPEGLGGRGGKQGEIVNPDDVKVDDSAAESEKPKRDRSQEPPAGNSPSYAIRRLTRAAEGKEQSRPIDPALAHELLQAHHGGGVVPHRAMVEAGFRTEPTPLEVFKRAWLRLSAAEVTEALNWISTPEASAGPETEAAALTRAQPPRSNARIAPEARRAALAQTPPAACGTSWRWAGRQPTAAAVTYPCQLPASVQALGVVGLQPRSRIQAPVLDSGAAHGVLCAACSLGRTFWIPAR